MAKRVQKYQYQVGFGNLHATEALPNSLPVGQNSPQVCPRGLYAEQLSGSPFTAPRVDNQKTYAGAEPPTPNLSRADVAIAAGSIEFAHLSPTNPLARLIMVSLRMTSPNACPIRHNFVGCRLQSLRATNPQILFKVGLVSDFISICGLLLMKSAHVGIVTICGAGDAAMKEGCAVHIYCANKDMENKAFYNSDGDFLIGSICFLPSDRSMLTFCLVPQQGRLDIRTEMGLLEVFPGEICVIPRGVYFSVCLPDGPSRGYINEVYNGHFKLPELGPIGANGLANPRDFQVPVASFVDKSVSTTIWSKFMGQLFQFTMDHSPFNIVAWHGNYYPYKYDLDHYNVINSVSFDHPDPSIFTVLTCPSATPGTACCDFVIFPPRWQVQDRTFRPPYYHRNLMSEYMGLIRGEYEAKKEGFLPGGGSLHSCMSAHGPDAKTFEKASAADLVPVKLQNTMAFMFESTYMFKITDFAQKNYLDEKYFECWQDLPSHFKTDAPQN